jgi:hypothetical protein
VVGEHRLVRGWRRGIDGLQMLAVESWQRVRADAKRGSLLLGIETKSAN